MNEDSKLNHEEEISDNEEGYSELPSYEDIGHVDHEDTHDGAATREAPEQPDELFLSCIEEESKFAPDLDINELVHSPCDEGVHDGSEWRSATMDVALPTDWTPAFRMVEPPSSGGLRTHVPPPEEPVPMEDLSPEELKLQLPKQWQNKNKENLEKVPTFYPMEATNVYLPMEDFTEGTMLTDIAGCFKEMSVHAVYFNDPVAVAILTPENVEMYLSFWKDKAEKQVIVEIQRRRGCSVTFHKYANHMLDAATNKFTLDSASEFVRASQDIDMASMKNAELMLYGEVAKNSNKLKEESVVAIEIGYELLKKERIDARLLGLESFYLLTNPRRTALSTTIMASKAVLLGEGYKEIREMILHIIYNKSLGDDNFGKGGMDMEPDSDDEDFFEADGDTSEYPPHLKDTVSVMYNLALSTLANALEVMSNEDPDAIIKFMQYAESNGDLDILIVLLNETARAEKKPHNACVTCKSLRFICKKNKKAMLKVQENVKDVINAHKVGSKTHRRLEDEALKLWKLLYYGIN